jgi:hypothetical protein
MLSLSYKRFLNKNIEIVATYITGEKQRERERERGGEEMKMKEKKLFNVQTRSGDHWVPGFFSMNKAAGV